MRRDNPRTLGARANFASTPLAGGSQPATESAAGRRGGDHALLGVHRRGGSTVRRRDNECAARAVCDLRVSRTFVTAPGRVVPRSQRAHAPRAFAGSVRKRARWLNCSSAFGHKKFSFVVREEAGAFISLVVR